MAEESLQHWLTSQLPPTLHVAAPEIRQYDDELVIILQIAAPTADDADAISSAQARISQLRAESRALRMQIARELEQRTGLPVAWGMRTGTLEQIFTSRTTPVMTRLGRAERDVLDTLVAAGIADTRSSALAYAVRAFAAEHSSWLTEVRAAIAEVERVRSRLKLRPRKGAPQVFEE
jgi:hypothetical protein